jgi:hypothetical protein
MFKKSYEAIVIGGGASGMMAAWKAAESGKSVLLIEKNKILGKKLLISGKGRCNLTNAEDNLETFISHFGPTGPFLYNAFSRFFNQDLINFFERRGLELKIERGGRVFPASERASSVVDVFRKYLKEGGVDIIYNSKVEGILSEEKRIRGIKLDNTESISAPKVILATGGLSYPSTGSTGDGFKILEKLGHTIIPLRPGLVPLETKEGWVRELQGLSLENVKVSLYQGNKKILCEFGEILFTHFGVSGPIILSISGKVVDLLGERNKDLYLSINLKPALTVQELEARLLRDFAKFGQRNFRNFLKELLPRKMIPIFVKLLEINPDKKVNQLTAEGRRRLISLLTNFKLTIKRSRPIKEALITRGGISTKEINPQTMESKLIRGLYLCGEIIDVDAKTGGYNLQAAFSTGYVAGSS